MTAAVVLARAPGADGTLSGLADVLDAAARADLQARLMRRAATWAADVAGEHAVVVVEPDDARAGVAPLTAPVVVEPQGPGTRGERIAAAVNRAFERWGG